MPLSYGVEPLERVKTTDEWRRMEERAARESGYKWRLEHC